VVVNGYGELPLGGVLPDYVLIQEFFDFERFRELAGRRGGLVSFIVFKDGIANRDTFVADVRARIIAGGRNQFPDYILTFMAERAAKRLIGSGPLQTRFPQERSIENTWFRLPW
jgi:hypothetical protein